MKNLTLILSAFTLLLFSCKKEEKTTPVETPKVALQTEYRLQEIKIGAAITNSYTYNDENLVSTVSNYYTIPKSPYTQPVDIVVNTYYEYDESWRVTRSGTSLNPHENDSEYDYNTELLPITRYKGKYAGPLYEYSYDGNRLTELKIYDIKGNLSATKRWAYDNGDDNATTYTVIHDGKESVTRYLAYDNANALRLAMPGIQDLELATSVNNVLKVEETFYDTSGNPYVRITDYEYEYNAGNFPVKSTVTFKEKGNPPLSQVLYYTYNK